MNDLPENVRHPRAGGDPYTPTPRQELQRQRLWIPAFAGMTRVAAASTALLLVACATQVPIAVTHTASTPGFLLGLWHGFIFPVAWVLSLVMPDVAVYAVPNNGGWYDFGYFVGIVFLGVGARSTRTVYVTRRIRG